MRDRTVLVTRPEPGASVTASRLQAEGWRPVVAPFLTVRPVHVALPHPATLQAVVAASGNAVALPGAYHGLPLLAVGNATASRARAAGFHQVHSADGDAAALTALATRTLDPAQGPLLLATGRGQGMALARALRRRGFAVRRRAIYAAVPVRRFPRARGGCRFKRAGGRVVFLHRDGACLRALPAYFIAHLPPVHRCGCDRPRGGGRAAALAVARRPCRSAAHSGRGSGSPMTDDSPKPANEPVKPAPPAPSTSAKGPQPQARPGTTPVAGPTTSGGGQPRPSSTPVTPTAKPVTPPVSAGATPSPPPPASTRPSIPMGTATSASSSASASPPSSGSPSDGAGSTPLFVAIGVLAIALIAGGIYLFEQNGASADQLAQLQSKLDSLNQRTAALEARPVPPPPNLQPIEQRLTALENKPAPTAQLDQAGHNEIAALAGRVDGVAARQALLGTQEQTDFGHAEQELKDAIAKVGDQESADVGKLSDQEKADFAKLNDQLTSFGARLDAATKAAGEIGAITTRQARLADLQAASGALAAGRPLGAIPNAPPALAQFATKAPPTEADLRLSFDQAAASARKAGQPYADTQPFLSRLWDRAQSGLVVREGNRVIVGDAVSGVLDSAKQQLDAGDIAGAVTALNGLAGPAAQAMAPWRAQAQSLLDARAALITAARG